MKKIFIVLCLSILLLTGCDKDYSNAKDIYLKYIKELKTVKETSDILPFDIEVKYDKLTNNEIRYQVIIDNVKEDLFDVEMISIHNKETNDVFPSIGIFDKKEDLKVNKKPSGLILVGYIDYDKKIEDFKCNMKVMIKYKTSDKKIHKVYYVTKK